MLIRKLRKQLPAASESTSRNSTSWEEYNEVKSDTCSVSVDCSPRIDVQSKKTEVSKATKCSFFGLWQMLW